jgi:hypothetical protein
MKVLAPGATLSSLGTFTLLLSLVSCGSEVSQPTGPGSGGPSPTSAATPTPGPAAANRPPTVALDGFEPRNGIILRVTEVGLAVKASDPDGDPLTYRWDFGDGNTQIAGPGVSHVFDRAGSRGVSVTVDDGRGGRTEFTITVEIEAVSGRYVGIMTNGPNGGKRLGGEVTQTGRRFDGNWSTHNGDGTGDDGGVAVAGVLSDPRDMAFTVNGFCASGAALTFRGSFSSDLRSFNGESSGCDGLTFRRIELFR